MSTEGEAY